MEGKKRLEATELECWLFASGNFGSNLVFVMISSYIMYFYTKYIGDCSGGCRYDFFGCAAD